MEHHTIRLDSSARERTITKHGKYVQHSVEDTEGQIYAVSDLDCAHGTTVTHGVRHQAPLVGHPAALVLLHMLLHVM